MADNLPKEEDGRKERMAYAKALLESFRAYKLFLTGEAENPVSRGSIENFVFLLREEYEEYVKGTEAPPTKESFVDKIARKISGTPPPSPQNPRDPFDDIEKGLVTLIDSLKEMSISGALISSEDFKKIDMSKFAMTEIGMAALKSIGSPTEVLKSNRAAEENEAMDNVLEKDKNLLKDSLLEFQSLTEELKAMNYVDFSSPEKSGPQR